MWLYLLISGTVMIWRGIIPLKIRKSWKILLSFAVLIIAGKFYVLRLFGGRTLFNPELPAWVLLPFTWLFAVQMFFTLWLIFMEAYYWILGKRLGMVRSRWLISGLVFSALLVSYGMYEGMKTPEIVRKELKFRNLPAGLDGLTVAHLSDIHVDPFTGAEKVRKIVDLNNSLKPDLVVITGDFVDGRANVRSKDLQEIQRLESRFGVFGVPGNHEYYSGYNEWMKLIRSYGVRMLVNRHEMILPELALGGVSDPAAKKRGGALPDVEKAFMGTAPGTFKILLAHQPKLAPEAAEAGVDLQLSGHTHGGMIRGLDLLVGVFNFGMYSGEYDFNGTKVFISNGTGIWNGFPLRLGHRSEIVLITLKKE